MTQPLIYGRPGTQSWGCGAGAGIRRSRRDRLPAAIYWANQALGGFARYRSVLDRELGSAPSKTLGEAHLRLLLATANSQGELSDAISALLVLHDQLVSTATGVTRTRKTADASARAAVLAAEHVLTSFLRRVSVSATSR